MMLMRAFKNRFIVKNRLVILMFHRVLPEFDPLRPGEETRYTFVEKLRLLKKHFNVLPLEQAVLEMRQGKLIRNAVCITFDDGYADNMEIALPILQEAKMHATFFITTDFLDGGMMWNDVVIEAIRYWPKDSFEHPLLGNRKLALTNDSERYALLKSLIPALKYLGFDQRTDIVKEFLPNVPSLVVNNMMMTQTQLKKMVDAGMAIGAHTQSHPILSKLDDARSRNEIVKSKERLAQITGTPVNIFAYPNGRPGQDYLPQHVDIVKSAGFKFALSTRQSSASAYDDEFQLPRFAPWQENKVKLFLRLISI